MPPQLALATRRMRFIPSIFAGMVLALLCGCAAQVATADRPGLAPQAPLTKVSMAMGAYPIRIRYSWNAQIGEVGASGIAVDARHLLTCRHNLPPFCFITTPDADPTRPERPWFTIYVAGQRRAARVVEAGDGQEWVDDWALIQLSATDIQGEQIDAGCAGWRIGEPVVGEDVIIVGYPGAAAGEMVVLTAQVARIRPDRSFELKLSADSPHQADADASLRGLSGGAVLRAADAEGCHALLGMARGGERTHVFGIMLKRRLLAIPIPSQVIELESGRSMFDPET